MMGCCCLCSYSWMTCHRWKCIRVLLITLALLLYSSRWCCWYGCVDVVNDVGGGDVDGGMIAVVLVFMLILVLVSVLFLFMVPVLLLCVR